MKKKQANIQIRIYISLITYIYRSSYHFSPRRFLRHDVKKKKKEERIHHLSLLIHATFIARKLYYRAINAFRFYSSRRIGKKLFRRRGIAGEN